MTVRFSKSGEAGEAARRHREKSFEYQQRKAEEEPWRVTRFHHLRSQQWEEETQKLFCGRMDDDLAAANNGSEEAAGYLKKLT